MSYSECTNPRVSHWSRLTFLLSLFLNWTKCISIIMVISVTNEIFFLATNRCCIISDEHLRNYFCLPDKDSYISYFHSPNSNIIQYIYVEFKNDKWWERTTPPSWKSKVESRIKKNFYRKSSFVFNVI